MTKKQKMLSAPVAETPPVTANYYLTNLGWLIHYEVRGETVTARRSYYGHPVDVKTMTKAEAREHYRGWLRQGCKRQGGDF